MYATRESIGTANALSESARRIFLKREPRGPLLLGDWCEAVFFHYAVAPEVLQPFVPVELDLWESQAFVSLVAFTMRRLRPSLGGRLTEWLMWPFATQWFLNLRTYVRRGSEGSIYFLKEWNSSRTSGWLAPKLYGLPYCIARLDYHHERDMGRGQGAVRADGASFEFSYSCAELNWDVCLPGSMDAFLLERYTAFASAEQQLRCFHVWHAPWLQRRVSHLEIRNSLVRQYYPWWRTTEFVAANVSSGTVGVWMGRPHRASDLNAA